MVRSLRPRARAVNGAAAVACFFSVTCLLTVLGRQAAHGWQLPAEADGGDCKAGPTCANTCFTGAKADNGCPAVGPANIQQQCIASQNGNGNVYGTKCEQNNNVRQDCNPFVSTDTQQSQCTNAMIWLCGCMVDNGQGGQSHPVCDYSNCPCMGNNNGGMGTMKGNNSCT